MQTEELTARNIDLPVITEVYDLLSGMRDGTITSQAPIIVSGSNLNMYSPDISHLCLVSTDKHEVIEVHHVYKCSAGQVVAVLPPLKAGKYFPAVKFLDEKGKEEAIYYLPITWVVSKEPYVRNGHPTFRYEKEE